MHPCGVQKTAVRNQVPPTIGVPRDQTQVFRIGSRCLYPH